MQELSLELIEKAGQGDIAAFEEIYRQTSGFVYNVAFRVTGNNHDAAEVTQDVFMKAYRSLKNFEYRSSLKTWLYRIAVNLAINHYRKNARHAQGRVEFDPASDYGYDYKTDPAAQIIEKEERERKVVSLLDALEPEQRVCIVLREIEGLSYEEIAGALKININTVRSRLSRAREKLLAFAEKR